jgi:hypothetical protein
MRVIPHRVSTVHSVILHFDPRFFRLVALRYATRMRIPTVRLIEAEHRRTHGSTHPHKGTNMNINLRALVFGTVVAAALTVTMDVVAAETRQVVRLDGVEVIAHRDAFDADGNLKVIRLDAVVVTAHKSIE